jgi:hypothetical protein
MKPSTSVLLESGGPARGVADIRIKPWQAAGERHPCHPGARTDGAASWKTPPPTIATSFQAAVDSAAVLCNIVTIARVGLDALVDCHYVTARSLHLAALKGAKVDVQPVLSIQMPAGLFNHSLQMDPRSNLDLAQFLAKRPKNAPEEASLRGATGRAYYAAFAIARDALRNGGFSISFSADAHSRVVSLMKSSSDVDVGAAGGLLEDLRINRNHADYDVGSQAVRGGLFSPARTQYDLGRAAMIIDAVAEAQKKDPRLGIT